MDTLFFDEKNYTKFIETLINVSIIGSLVWLQTLPPIMAIDERIAHLSTPTLEIDTGQIQDKIMTEISPEYRQQKFNEKIKTTYPKGIIVDVDSGIKHIRLRKYYNGKPVRINIVQVNTQIAKDISIKPALSVDNKVQGRRTISTIAKKENAIVAINGTFFKPQTGVPLGTLMINNKMYTGPIYDRVAMGFFDSNAKDPFDIARVQFNSMLISGNQKIKVDNINQPRMLSTYVLAYTNDWGKFAPPSPKYGVQIAIQDNKVIKKSANPLEIPQNGYVIVAPKQMIDKINLNDKIKLDIKTNPEWKNVKHIVSGGPYLVKNNQVFVDMTSQKLGSIGGRNPRSAIGYTADNDFILVAVDGREGSSVGMTLMELANFMKSIGCTNAINLDGGGSTVMYVKGQIVNKPAQKGGIALSNALVLAKGN